MTSPSAAHTGHVGPLDEIIAASEDLGLYDLASTTEEPAATLVTGAEALATMLVDAGHASWCPVCGGTGSITYPKLGGRAGTFVNVRRTCARCRGGRLNPFHGCTFTTDDPCACTTRCQVYRPQETPTP